MFSHRYFVTDGFIVTPLALGKGEPLVISYNRWVCRYATNLSDNRRGFPRTTDTDITGGSVVAPLALGKEWVTGYSQWGCC